MHYNDNLFALAALNYTIYDTILENSFHKFIKGP